MSGGNGGSEETSKVESFFKNVRAVLAVDQNRASRKRTSRPVYGKTANACGMTAGPQARVAAQIAQSANFCRSSWRRTRRQARAKQVAQNNASIRRPLIGQGVRREERRDALFRYGVIRGSLPGEAPLPAGYLEVRFHRNTLPPANGCGPPLLPLTSTAFRHKNPRNRHDLPHGALVARNEADHETI